MKEVSIGEQEGCEASTRDAREDAVGIEAF